MSYIDVGEGFTSSWTPVYPWKDHVSSLKFRIGC
jgi:hypothetical protein